MPSKRKYIKSATQTIEDQSLVRAKNFEAAGLKWFDNLSEKEQQEIFKDNPAIIGKFLPQVKTTDEELQASHISLIRSFDLLPDQDDLSRRCTVLESHVRKLESLLEVEKEFNQSTIVYMRSRFRYTINKVRKLHPEAFNQMKGPKPEEVKAVDDLEDYSQWLLKLHQLFKKIIRKSTEYSLRLNGYPITEEEIETETRKVLGDEFWNTHYGGKKDEQKTKEEAKD